MNQYQEEIVILLRDGITTDKRTKFKDLKKYIGTEYDFIGLSSPKQKEIFKNGFSFSELSLQEQLVIWDELWKKSGQFEVMSFALQFVGNHFSKFEPAALWKVVRHWVLQIDNWAHSDGLSAIYSRLLEKMPDTVYEQYKAWNTSANAWERRQSLVGLIYYSRTKKVHLSYQQQAAMVEPLLYDKDYFVQKGVGWTLREMGNLYPEETLRFLEKHIKAISATAFSAAAEKLPADVKLELKQLRKK